MKRRISNKLNTNYIPHIMMETIPTTFMLIDRSCLQWGYINGSPS